MDYKVSSIIGFGATYSLSKNLIFDIGLNHRLLGKEDDFNIFSGYTFFCTKYIIYIFLVFLIFDITLMKMKKQKCNAFNLLFSFIY